MVVAGAPQVFEMAQQDARASQIVESVPLIFKDELDHGVGVYDYPDGNRIHVFGPETGGFVRTAMRAVAHKRKVAGIGPEAPFELARTTEDRLILKDTVTGQIVILNAFGKINADEFAQFLPSRGAQTNDA